MTARPTRGKKTTHKVEDLPAKRVSDGKSKEIKGGLPQGPPTIKGEPPLGPPTQQIPVGPPI